MTFNNDSLSNILEENLTASDLLSDRAHEHDHDIHDVHDYPIDLNPATLAVSDSPRSIIAPTRLVVPEIIPTNSLSQSRINGLLSGYSWTIPASRVLTYSFYESSVWNGSYYGSETGVTEVSEAVKTNVRNILNWLETVINIDFQEVTETSTSGSVGTLRYMLSNNPGYAYAYYPTTHPLGGDVHLRPSYQNTSSTNGFEQPAGNHGYMSLIHETLHGLGLKHPHEGTALPTVEDNTANTVMSYRFTGNSSGTAMAYDIGALQNLYGTKAKETGNTSYQFTTRIDQFSVNSVLSINTPNLTKQTIWDTGGTDTLDFSNLSFESLGYRFDMNEGGWLTANRAYRFQQNISDYNVTGGTIQSTYFDFGTSIAYDVTLENLVNSSSSDTIYANNAANEFQGYTTGRSVGADVLWNTSNNDTLDLSAYSFNAVTRTQNGNDLVIGLGSNGSVTVKNYYTSPQLNILYSNVLLPTISLGVSPSSVAEDGTNILVYTFTRIGDLSSSLNVNFNVSGDAVFNTDYSQSGATYNSTTGSITFNAGASTTTLTLSPTDDTEVEYDETIGITLASNASYIIGTNSTVISTILNDDIAVNPSSISLSVNQTAVAENGTPNLIYTFTRTGNTTNSLTVNFSVNGTATWNTDYTVIGSSSFSATVGNLTFAANSATATLTIDPKGDALVENPETVGITLTSGLNYLIATPATVTGTITNDDGDASNNTLIGGSSSDNLNGGDGNDTLIGNAGNDTLNGGTGVDSLSGGLGNDSYFIDNLGDIVTENVSEGTDLLQASITVDLNSTTNIENLTLTGTANINATGDGNNNTITGNAGNNTLTGNGGNDQLNGGVGVDNLIGGLGNDTYTVDNIADVCIENVGEGIDTLKTPFTSNLTGTNLENLTLTGTGNINGTGDSNNNTLTGNTSNNTLTGGSGIDKLLGGNGNDRLVGESGNDTLTGGSGIDTFAFVSLADGIDRISDFSVVDDLIEISASGFGGGLLAGTLDPSLLRVGAGITTANTATQRLIYNTTTGALFFDADGNSTLSTATQFVTLSANLALTSADFSVV